MHKKWFLTLAVITSILVVTGFFLDSSIAFGYRWMTTGMSIVAFIYYFIVTSSNEKDSKKMIGGNLTAIVLKFILSGVVVILYLLLYGIQDPLDFAFFFMAYGIFSVVNYIFSYNYKMNAN